MKSAILSVQEYFVGLGAAWDRFWFAPRDPAVLCVIRIVTGLLLLWTHAVWSLDLLAFFGPEGWIPPEMTDRLHAHRMAVGFFGYVTAPWAVWTFHAASLTAFFLLTIGLFSRVAAVWAYLAALQYALHITPGAFFGLDKINLLLALYLMLGPCGARYSVDRWLRVRRGVEPADPDELPESWTANLAVRLIQVHLCVVYLFGGLGKLQGDLWWDGAATWFAVANVEYRSLDMTWLAGHLWLSELLAHATVFFELFYCCLVWNRWTRPLVLLTALGVHGFIGLAMGMPEFSLAMLTANAAFLPTGLVRGLLDPIGRRLDALGPTAGADAEEAE
ncbi:HTTM domain-containing protein [Botrimarina sp.]|uniref:HTTM domain-containing protein n=1 Tax=Botrimarina sp. TaxID=2795802 RepID=UPI0032EE42EC